jgi:hypothetical protein
VARNAKFVGEENVERETKRPRDFEPDNDSAARDSKDNGVAATDELNELRGELASGVLAITEDHGAIPPWDQDTPVAADRPRRA